MKTKFDFIVLILLFVCLIDVNQAQDLARKYLSCEPTSEEILSVLKERKVPLFDSEKILSIGEIKLNGFIELSEPRSLTQVIAMHGGISYKKSDSAVYVIRRENGEITSFKTNYKSIKKGEEKDFSMKKGDVVFIPQACKDNKRLLPDSFDLNQQFEPKGYSLSSTVFYE